jgi:hypothetical protein
VIRPPDSVCFPFFPAGGIISRRFPRQRAFTVIYENNENAGKRGQRFEQ